METIIAITFFIIMVFFLNVLGLSHYHWSHFAQPGRKAKLVTFLIEAVAIICLGTATLLIFI